MVIVSIPIIDVIYFCVAAIGDDDMDIALRLDVYVEFGDFNPLEIGMKYTIYHSISGANSLPLFVFQYIADVVQDVLLWFVFSVLRIIQFDSHLTLNIGPTDETHLMRSVDDTSIKFQAPNIELAELAHALHVNSIKKEPETQNIPINSKTRIFANDKSRRPMDLLSFLGIISSHIVLSCIFTLHLFVLANDSWIVNDTLDVIPINRKEEKGDVNKESPAITPM